MGEAEAGLRQRLGCGAGEASGAGSAEQSTRGVAHQGGGLATASRGRGVACGRPQATVRLDRRGALSRHRAATALSASGRRAGSAGHAAVGRCGGGEDSSHLGCGQRRNPNAGGYVSTSSATRRRPCVPRRSSCRRSTEERRRVEALAALGPNLEQAEQRLAEYAATEEEIGASLKLTRERCGRESEEAQNTIVAIDERAKEQAESGRGGHQHHRGGTRGSAACIRLETAGGGGGRTASSQSAGPRSGRGLSAGDEGRGVAPGGTRQREST